MLKNKMPLLISFIIAIIPFIIYYSLFPRFPDVVPIHYDGNGVADRFVAKTSWELLLMSALGGIGFLIMVVLYSFFRKFQLSSYKGDIPTAIRIWNVGIVSVTILFASIGSYTLIMLV